MNSRVIKVYLIAVSLEQTSQGCDNTLHVLQADVVVVLEFYFVLANPELIGL